jgi:hypothetical protein
VKTVKLASEFEDVELSQILSGTQFNLATVSGSRRMEPEKSGKGKQN